MVCQLSRRNVARKLIISFFIGVFLSNLLVDWSYSQTVAPDSVAPDHKINLIPDQMTLFGEVTTRANCDDPTVCQWLDAAPAGTIMLGVDPTSPEPKDWDGGSAKATFFLPDVHSPTVYVLKISWPDRDGKGLHSPDRNRVGIITLDGKPLWQKRTTRQSTFDDYYAAEHQPILTTIVANESDTHTLSFSVPSRTAWDLSEIELSAYPYPTTIRGIAYSPYRDCQYPDGAQPSIQEIEEDLFRLSHTATAVRTYSATGVNNTIPALAHQAGLQVYAGAWLDGIPKDEVEIQALINLANTGDVTGVIVGNEYYLRHRTSEAVDYLRQRIIHVKNNIPAHMPVMTGEIDNLMFDWENERAVTPLRIKPIYRPIFDEVDFVMIHTYPFWNGLLIDGAAGYTIDRYKAIRTLIEREYPGQNKKIILGEAGWPSGIDPKGAAVPSLENQRRYLIEFLALAEQADVEYTYFDAFDELWKIGEAGRVGQNWGYSYSDRAAKHNFYGVLIPKEQLFPYRSYLPYITHGSKSKASSSPIIKNLPDLMAQTPTQASSDINFPIYTEWPAGDDNFYPSGWSGEIDAIDLFECDRTNPHSGEMAIRASFLPTSPGNWGGVYWQYPEDNWGNINDGINLAGAERLTFWARSNTPNAQVKFFIGGIGYPDGTACSSPSEPYPDSVCPKIEQEVTLSSAWTKYTIDVPPSRDLSRVIGGFGWSTQQKVTFYLDDIIYEFD